MSYSGSQITYTWESEGTFDVTLTVTGGDGATDSATKSVVVENSTPVADFSYSPSSPVPDEEVTLDGTPSADSDGSVEEYDWTVETSNGYSMSYSGSQITYAWESEGTFDVTLTVTDNGEKTNSVTETIDVGNTSPTANVSVTPERPDVGQAVTFTGSDSRDAEGNVDEYAWSIAGSEKYGEEVTHAFDSRGEHAVELTVTDTAGATDSSTVRLFVGNRAPSPSVSHSPTEVTAGTTVTFDASESTDADGSIAEYRWTLPDGTTATGERIEYAFGEAGSRTVELALTDDEGRTTTETLTAEVRAPATSEQSPSRSTTAAPDDRPGAARSSTESQDDGVLFPLLAGAIGLGGAGLTYRYWSGRRADAGGPDVADVQERARQTAAEADAARRRGEYETAIDAYEEAVAEFERAKRAATADGERAAAIMGSLAETREKLADVRERQSRYDAVREPLRNAESGLETAIARHAQDQIVVARRDYRQAKTQYERALDALDESDDGVIDDEGGVTVPVDAEGDHIPEKLIGWPRLSDREREVLSEAGLGSVTDLKDASEEVVTEVARRDEIDEELADRLRAVRWWHGEDERTFTSRKAIERRRDHAHEGNQMLL